MKLPILFATLALMCGAVTARAADPTPPIKLAYVEGDFAGATTIWSEDGKHVMGYIAYRQHLTGDRLHIERVAHFRDGSSDADEAEVKVGAHLESISGRSIIRDTRNKPTVDLKIDVPGKRVTGFYIDDGKRETVDEEVDIGPGTYWGPLFNIVLKNFAANATGDTLVFQSILPTPKPRVIDMELKRDGTAKLSRTGGRIDTTRYTLLPTINFIIDPILQHFVPTTEFFLDSGTPPSLARFAGPRNYAGQLMRLE
ncbi:MAG: hypothetical protein ABI629_15105 [bacterium]